MSHVNFHKLPMLSHLRRSADIQGDQERLEALASTRTQLKETLSELTKRNHGNGVSEGYYYMTPEPSHTNSTAHVDTLFSIDDGGSSFFHMDAKTIRMSLESKLKEVEREILQVCSQVQRRLDA